MKSFRTELENPVVEKDLLDLEKKIYAYHKGQLDEDRFRSLRLARGIYGQRQPGVQMIRIKIPFGKLSAHQLRTIAKISDQYSTGLLHITTRQDIQIHYVSLDDTPELWAQLEASDITLREACGNTVRNVTASVFAGVDPEEHFDVSPYAEQVFRYFLRNPVQQDMGRKFKFSFSGSDKDDALSYMHDLGFIAQLKEIEGEKIKGFKVMLGGGLGAQAMHAHLVHDFLPADEIIPYSEAVIRVFDRYGERQRRQKARLKFLIQSIGIEKFIAYVNEERRAVNPTVPSLNIPVKKSAISSGKTPSIALADKEFLAWKKSNVKAQKQIGYVSAGLRVALGNFSTNTARTLANILDEFPSMELRLSISQNIVLRYIPEDELYNVYEKLKPLNLSQPGFHSTADITSCPGTDTCNLAISNSTQLAHAISKLIEEEYPKYLNRTDVQIKISGCMNSCGQHMMASIGFQGMTIKSGQHTAPAVQVLLGGANLGQGKGRFAKKVIKIPSKRALDALKRILNDFEAESEELNFDSYFEKRGEAYFYTLLKDLNDAPISENEFLDWGQNEVYKKEIGVGECAGVVIDLVATLFQEAQEKLAWAQEAQAQAKFSDARYHAYTAYLQAAKAHLLSIDVQSNSQANILQAYQEHLAESPDFESEVLSIKEAVANAENTASYLGSSARFLEHVALKLNKN